MKETTYIQRNMREWKCDINFLKTSTIYKVLNDSLLTQTTNTAKFKKIVLL